MNSAVKTYTAILELGIATFLFLPRPAVAQHYSDWSAPVNLGSPTNTLNTDEICGADFQPSISRDGLSLYFTRGGRFASWISALSIFT